MPTSGRAWRRYCLGEPLLPCPSLNSSPRPPWTSIPRPSAGRSVVFSLAAPLGCVLRRVLGGVLRLVVGHILRLVVDHILRLVVDHIVRRFGVLRLGAVGHHVHNGPPHEPGLDAGGHFEDDVLVLHRYHGGVHACRGADPGAGLDVALRLLSLLLAAALRPDGYEVEQAEKNHEPDQQVGAATARLPTRRENHIPHHGAPFPLTYR